MTGTVPRRGSFRRVSCECPENAGSLAAALPVTAHVRTIEVRAYRPGEWRKLANFNLAD